MCDDVFFRTVDMSTYTAYAVLLLPEDLALDFFSLFWLRFRLSSSSFACYNIYKTPQKTGSNDISQKLNPLLRCFFFFFFAFPPSYLLLLLLVLRAVTATLCSIYTFYTFLHTHTRCPGQLAVAIPLFRVSLFQR